MSGLPVAFDAWFARAVARDPSARYQDGGEACRELVRLPGPDAAIDETIDARALASSPREASTSPQRAPITDVRPRTHGSLRAVAAVAALVVLLAVGLRFWPRGGALPEAPTSSAVPSASAAPPTPVVITSLPRPACAHPKVISLYASALQDFRDANWDHATARLGEAAELEPGCAAVQLRLAMTQSGDEARATYQRALEHRTDLDPRDRALLDAWEPLTHDPTPDAGAAAARLRAAAEARPGGRRALDPRLRARTRRRAGRRCGVPAGDRARPAVRRRAGQQGLAVKLGTSASTPRRRRRSTIASSSRRRASIAGRAARRCAGRPPGAIRRSRICAWRCRSTRSRRIFDMSGVASSRCKTGRTTRCCRRSRTDGCARRGRILHRPIVEARDRLCPRPRRGAE